MLSLIGFKVQVRGQLIGHLEKSIFYPTDPDFIRIKENTNFRTFSEFFLFTCIPTFSKFQYYANVYKKIRQDFIQIKSVPWTR